MNSAPEKPTPPRETPVPAPAPAPAPVQTPPPAPVNPVVVNTNTAPGNFTDVPYSHKFYTSVSYFGKLNIIK